MSRLNGRLVTVSSREGLLVPQGRGHGIAAVPDGDARPVEDMAWVILTDLPPSIPWVAAGVECALVHVTTGSLLVVRRDGSLGTSRNLGPHVLNTVALRDGTRATEHVTLRRGQVSSPDLCVRAVLGPAFGGSVGERVPMHAAVADPAWTAQPLLSRVALLATALALWNPPAAFRPTLPGIACEVADAVERGEISTAPEGIRVHALVSGMLPRTGAGATTAGSELWANAAGASWPVVEVVSLRAGDPTPLPPAMPTLFIDDHDDDTQDHVHPSMATAGEVAATKVADVPATTGSATLVATGAARAGGTLSSTARPMTDAQLLDWARALKDQLRVVLGAGRSDGVFDAAN